MLTEEASLSKYPSMSPKAFSKIGTIVGPRAIKPLTIEKELARIAELWAITKNSALNGPERLGLVLLARR